MLQGLAGGVRRTGEGGFIILGGVLSSRVSLERSDLIQKVDSREVSL